MKRKLDETSGDKNIPFGAQFHETIAKTWASGYERKGFKQRLKVFQEILEKYVNYNERWLDLGCGSGVLTQLLAEKGVTISAMDGSPAMLREARKKVESSSPHAKFILGDVQDLSCFKEGEFDGILCSSVIEYVAAPDVLLTEISRVLKKKGILIISLPPKGSLVRNLQKIARFIFKCFGVNKFTYLNFSKHEKEQVKLEKWMEEKELKLINIYNFDPLLPKILLKVFRPALVICEAIKE
tara:strand:+ start:929 stop:1648 length:720 start_codon:yes stop_codon:yes gene_type:complete